METIHNEDSNESRAGKKWEARAPSATMRWLVILGVLFLAAAVFSGVYAYQENRAMSDLTVQNQALHSTIDRMRIQIGALRDKLDQNSSGLQVEPAPVSTAPPAQAPPANSPAAKRTTSGSSAAQDRRMKQVRSQLAEQQKQLKDTRDQLAAAKSDLEGKLGSTRDELTDSIARTHDEIVALEKRGERRYYEFDLSKSKGFEREGPIQVSLRKADAKHQSFDLMMLVDDHQLSKKKVDLYEPIWLHESDQPQPVQVVVNKIDKNRVHGYVSAARYKDSELASDAAQASTDTASRPIFMPTPTSPSSSTSTPPSATATSSQEQE